MLFLFYSSKIYIIYNKTKMSQKQTAEKKQKKTKKNAGLTAEEKETILREWYEKRRQQYMRAKVPRKLLNSLVFGGDAKKLIMTYAQHFNQKSFRPNLPIWFPMPNAFSKTTVHTILRYLRLKLMLSLLKKKKKNIVHNNNNNINNNNQNINNLITSITETDAILQKDELITDIQMEQLAKSSNGFRNLAIKNENIFVLANLNERDRKMYMQEFYQETNVITAQFLYMNRIHDEKSLLPTRKAFYKKHYTYQKKCREVLEMTNIDLVKMSPMEKLKKSRIASNILGIKENA